MNTFNNIPDTHSHKLADNIAMVVILLMAIGTVFVFSASANVAQDFELDRLYDYPAMRQVLFFPAAVAIMFIASCLDYRIFSARRGWHKTPTTYMLLLSIALLALVLFPQIGSEVNMARRWFRVNLGPVTISFQPSELAKWVVIIFLAAFCDRYSESIRNFRKRFAPACLIVGLVVALVIVEDFGTAAYISLLAGLILLVAGAKLLHLASPLLLLIPAFIYAVASSPARMQRIKAFLNPEQWADSAAYQANQSLMALGSGGLLGRGLGKGICKYGHLPEDTTDFIFAIIGEEMGFAGCMVVILLFIAFLWLGMLVVARCRDNFGRLLAGGIVLAVAIQAAVNIGVVTVVLPTKGIPLPFVSSGGTSMILSAFAVGVLLNIAKQSPPQTHIQEPHNQ